MGCNFIYAKILMASNVKGHEIFIIFLIISLIEMCYIVIF